MSKKRKIGIVMFVAMCVCSLFTGFFVKEAKADAPLQSTDFVLNGDYSVDTMLMTDKEEHWYKLTITGDGNLEVKIMSYCSDSLSFALFNEDLSQQYKFSSCSDYVSGGSETSPVTATASKVLSKGIYYFRMSGTVGRYKLCGSFKDYGVNDTSVDSYDAPCAYTLGTTITGALTETDTEDWYRFVITQNGYYNLKIMSYSGDSMEFNVSNEDLSVSILKDYVSSGTDLSPTTYTKEMVLTAGTYYFKLYDAKGKYVFSIEEKSAAATTQTTKNTISKLSITAKRGKTSFTIKTIPYATLKVKYKGKTWSGVSSGISGKVKLYPGKKLKKGSKIKVTVKKTGYKTKTKTVKVK